MEMSFKKLYKLNRTNLPLRITEVRNNGTVRARYGRVTDTYNLRNIKPYKE